MTISAVRLPKLTHLRHQADLLSSEVSSISCAMTVVVITFANLWWRST